MWAGGARTHDGRITEKYDLMHPARKLYGYHGAMPPVTLPLYHTFAQLTLSSTTRDAVAFSAVTRL
jgi:hypothetical protein